MFIYLFGRYSYRVGGRGKENSSIHIFHVGTRPKDWVVFCCTPRCMSRKLVQKWSSSGTQIGAYTGCWCCSMFQNIVSILNTNKDYFVIVS